MKARTQIFGYVCTVTLTLEVWLIQRSQHVIGSWTTIVWKIIKIQLDSMDVMAHTWILSMCVLWHWPWQYDLASRSWHTLGSWKQLCEVPVLSRSNMAVRSYGPDTDFGYVCTVSLTLEVHVWPWVKVVTQPWVMDNNSVKFYPDSTWQWEVMARTPILGIICVLWPWP